MIRPKTTWVVKAAFVGAWVFLFSTPVWCPPAFSQDENANELQEAPPPPEDSMPPTEEAPPPTAESPTDSSVSGSQPTEELPGIEARVYNVTVEKISRSMRVYIVNDPREIKPRVGKILLFRQNGENFMAFRVLRTYTDPGQFAVARVKKYADHHVLEEGASYTVIEKIADLTPMPNLDGEMDRGDLNELEKDAGLNEKPGASPELSDSDLLDEGESKDQSKADLSKSLGDDSELDEATDTEKEIEDLENLEPDSLYSAEGFIIRENKPYERYQHWFSLEMRYFLAAARYLSSFGVEYGTNIGKSIFMEGNKLQDVLTLEFGIYMYQASALGDAGTDSYSVLPLSAGIRYNIFLNESFLVDFYGGLRLSLITSSTNPVQTVTNSLQGIGVSLGAGIMFKIGPQWFVRAQGGLDGFGGGLVLRF